MPFRRQLLLTFLAAGMPWPLAAAPNSAWWQIWCNQYLRNGRVVDWQQGISHSEGQGYGLLLAQAIGDRNAFEQIEAWTQAHLAVRQDRLMAWSRRQEDGRIDWRNATDGDLFRAWALLRADRDSGWSGYRDKALAVARDIADLCLSPDPRAPAEWLLLPGAEARRAPDRVLFNPSYIMPRALRELGEAAGDPRLLQAADHGETVLAELAASSQLWNWVDVTGSGFLPPEEHRAGWGFDALRIPLYLVWSGYRAHPAVAAARQNLMMDAQPGHVVVARDEEGHLISQSDRPGFLALRDLTHCATLPDWLSGAGDYYSDILLALCHVALREGECFA